MRLAALQQRSLRDLDATLGADELVAWHVFEEEFGLPDAFTLAGILGPLIASVFGSKKAFTAADYVPYFKAQARAQRQTVEQQRAIFHSCVAGLEEAKK